MSKYIILGIYEKPQEYTNTEVTTFFHTNTKYPNNLPYFSSIFTLAAIEQYAITKDQVPSILKLAQGKSYGCKRKNTKYHKIIVLKTNSPKLKKLLDIKGTL